MTSPSSTSGQGLQGEAGLDGRLERIERDPAGLGHHSDDMSGKLHAVEPGFERRFRRQALDPVDADRVGDARAGGRVRFGREAQVAAVDVRQANRNRPRAAHARSPAGPSNGIAGQGKGYSNRATVGAARKASPAARA